MLTRRDFVTRVGAFGGMGAMAATMQMLGLFGTQAALAAPELPIDFGRGRRVIILGAGIAGLISAYHLEKAGFDVHILEARRRVGGRVWTLRDGDRLDMIGEAPQTAGFSNGDYFNVGAARIPSWHQGILGYARQFGVPLEIEVNSSRSAYIVAKDGKRLRLRAAANDLRGHFSELLAKATNRGALDDILSAEDKARLAPLLRYYGDLDAQGRFNGTERSGLAALPGAGIAFGKAEQPISLSDLLANEQIAATLFEDNIFMQATMFQPVGGMDRIPQAIERALRKRPVLGAVITGIRHKQGGVEIGWRDAVSGAVTTEQGDFLVCTLPFKDLARIATNFDKLLSQAIASVVYDDAAKVAFDAPRFWEDDQIYGGISFVGGETSLIWYPSTGFHNPRGVIIGAYSLGESASRFERRPIAEQIAMARAAIERAHPGQGEKCIHPIAINWSKVPYSEGAWASWNGMRGGLQEAHIDTPAFKLLTQPHDRIFFAGSSLSQTPGWQEGAVNSAHAAVAAIASRMQAAALTSTAHAHAHAHA